MKKRIIVLAAAALMSVPGFASGNIPGDMTFKLRAAYNLGGMAPLDMPAAIRSIDSYNLTASLLLGVDAGWNFGSGWGIQSGLHFENKGMEAEISTKGYHMQMVQGTNSLEGFFTGHVHQYVAAVMLTMPIQATYKLGCATIKAGPYVSVLLNRNFRGLAFDGYLRQGNPTGPKIIIGNKEGEWATYDFSDEVRRFQCGLNAGADFDLSRGFGISADLNWGLTGLLKSSFTVVEQALYPIYATIGVFYRF